MKIRNFGGLRDWFEVFKTGTFKDSMDREHTITQRDLDEIAAAYNSSEHEAPLVIGHPADNAPAWGWVEKLKAGVGTLFAKGKDIIPEFEEMVKKGMFKKRSLSLYPDLTLRHIGFLGAMPPSVKGLANIKFGEPSRMGCYEFSEDNLYNPGERLNLLIKEFMERPGPKYDQLGREITHPVTFSEAMSIISAQNQELTQEYIESLKRRK